MASWFLFEDFLDGLHLYQGQYLANFLRSCDIENLKPIVTPMVTNLDLVSKEEQISEPRKCRQIMRSLQYITVTRLDTQLAINRLF